MGFVPSIPGQLVHHSEVNLDDSSQHQPHKLSPKKISEWVRISHFNQPLRNALHGKWWFHFKEEYMRLLIPEKV